MNLDPLALLAIAATRLDYARPALEDAAGTYGGTAPLAFVAPEVIAETGGRLRPVRTNLAGLAVDSLAERMSVTGFRAGGSDRVDPALWALWRLNRLDLLQGIAHREALSLARCAAIVWAGPDGAPLVSLESARQVWVEIDPATRLVAWAAKRWVGGDGTARAVIYEAVRITRLRSVVPLPLDPATGPWSPLAQLSTSSWVVEAELHNPLGVVPVVPFVNRATLSSPYGRSEVADLIDLQAALAKITTDMLVTSEFHAAPRRWATGVQLPTDENGEPLADAAQAFSQVPGRTWLLEDPEAKVGAFAAADLAGYVTAAQQLERLIATVAALPPHVVALAGKQGEPASADAIRASEAALTSRARDRMAAFGESWSDVMRLAVAVEDGGPPPPARDIEVVWGNPETRTDAESSDAAAKLAAIGVPLAALLPRLGFSPKEIDDIAGQRQAEALLRAGTDLSGVLP